MLLVGIAFVVLLLMGMPVAFAIGISGALFFLQHPELPFTIPVQVAVSQTQNFALLAIPLFILAGNLLNAAGITDRLLQLATVLTGRLKGGLAQVSLALSALMGGVSGSAIADAAMQSRMLGEALIRRGFDRGFTAAVLAFGAVLTPIVPPGIGMILYGTIGQVSIGRLFAAGFLPAFLLWLTLAITVWLVARRRGWGVEMAKRPTVGDTLGALRGGIWALLFPVFLLVGLRMGVFTPSEIGAFAVVYAVLIGTLVYRQLKGRSFVASLEQSLADVGAVMLLLALSAILSYGIVFERLPVQFAGLVTGLTSEVTVAMLIMVAFVLVAGFVVDATVLIIMLTPIFLPVIRQLDGDPVHFGIVFIVAATIGNFTPPVGAAMHAVCSILRCPVDVYTREALPLFTAVAMTSLVLVLVPGLVLFLPNLIFGG